MTKPNSVDEYIALQPPAVRDILQKIRQVIKQSAPQALETISYGIPTYKMKVNLVHFGAFKNHIGFYPTPQAIEQFRTEFSPYHLAKGSVQFPLDQPIPFDLIQRVVEYRVAAVTQ